MIGALIDRQVSEADRNNILRRYLCGLYLYLWALIWTLDMSSSTKSLLHLKDFYHYFTKKNRPKCQETNTMLVLHTKHTVVFCNKFPIWLTVPLHVSVSGGSFIIRRLNLENPNMVLPTQTADVISLETEWTTTAFECTYVTNVLRWIENL